MKQKGLTISVSVKDMDLFKAVLKTIFRFIYAERLPEEIRMEYWDELFSKYRKSKE